MSMLVLSPNEIYTLSLLASKPPQKFSPARRLYLDKKDKMRDHKKEYIEIIAKFYKDGLIWFDDDKKPHLIREIEAVFKTINIPEKVLHIKRLGSTDVKEQYYCKRGKLGILYLMGKEEVFHVLMYPIKDEALSQWFAEDLLKDVSFSNDNFPKIQMKLEAGEMLVIWLMKAAIDEKTEKVSIEELSSHENAKNMKVGDVFPFNEKVLFEYIEQKDNMSALLKGMIEKDILAKEEEKYCFSPVFKNIFDPEQVLDILTISQIGAFSRTKYLYILKRGYMLMEGILYDPLSWKIDIIPGNIDKKDLFDMLISWEEIRMSKEFKERIVKQLAAKGTS